MYLQPSAPIPEQIPSEPTERLDPLRVEMNKRVTKQLARLRIWRRRWPYWSIGQRAWLAEQMRTGIDFKEMIASGTSVFMPFTRLESDVEDWLLDVDMRFKAYARVSGALSLLSILAAWILFELLLGWTLASVQSILERLVGEGMAELALWAVIGLVSYFVLFHIVRLFAGRATVLVDLFLGALALLGLSDMVSLKSHNGDHAELVFSAQWSQVGFLMGVVIAIVANSFIRFREYRLGRHSGQLPEAHPTPDSPPVRVGRFLSRVGQSRRTPKA